MQPNVTLKLHMNNDCRRCCPRVLSCFCCCRGDEDQYVTTPSNRLQRVDRTNPQERRRTIEQLFHDIIPMQIGFDRWLEIKPEVERMLGITVLEMYKQATVIDKELVFRIVEIVNKTLKTYSDSEFESA